MAWYPKAIRKELPRKYAGYNNLAYYNRVNLHVAVSNGDSLYGYFNGSGKPSSHFYVRDSGVVEQYVNTAYAAEADLDGNDATISIETEGGVTNAQSEKWTASQVQALAELFAWAHETHGIKMRLATSSKLGSASKGLSWHRLGIDGNFPKTGILRGRLQRGGGMHYSKSRGKVCPGDAKIKQIPGILERARAIVSGEPVEPVELGDRRLREGDSGGDVKEGQRALNAANTRWSFTGLKKLTLDGSYGPLTEEFVIAFQAWVDSLPGLSCAVDGVLYTETVSYLPGGKSSGKVDAALKPPHPPWEGITTLMLRTWEEVDVFNPFTGEKIGEVAGGSEVEISSKTEVDGEVYYRTDWSTRQDNDSGILEGDLHPEKEPTPDPEPTPGSPRVTGVEKGIIGIILASIMAVVAIWLQ